MQSPELERRLGISVGTQGTGDGVLIRLLVRPRQDMGGGEFRYSAPPGGGAHWKVIDELECGREA